MDNLFSNITFLHPQWFIALALMPLIAFVYYKFWSKRFNKLGYPSIGKIKNKSLLGKIRDILFPTLRILSVLFLIIALARPQKSMQEEDIRANALDIFLVMDASGSMRATDFEPNRLEVCKQEAVKFIDKREQDRVGLIVFNDEAYTSCPLTTDKEILKEFVGNIQMGGATAMGMGLATAVNRLKNSTAVSKLIILLSDGANSAGKVDPLTATELAINQNIKIYSVGIGSSNPSKVPIGKNFLGQVMYRSEVHEPDEVLLKEIANRTGGKYFRADDETSLSNIYQEIDELEKTEIQISTLKRYSEEFPVFVMFALFFFLLEVTLRNTILKNVL